MLVVKTTSATAGSGTSRPPTIRPRKRVPSSRRRNPGSDRKSTRLNSSHRCISYAVFCLEKKIVEEILRVDQLAAMRNSLVRKLRGQGLGADGLATFWHKLPPASVKCHDYIAVRIHQVIP